MRIFLTSVIAAAAFAAVFAVTLNQFQTSIADATATSAVRLDQQETVDWYGREPAG